MSGGMSLGELVCLLESVFFFFLLRIGLSVRELVCLVENRFVCWSVYWGSVLSVGVSVGN